MIETNYSSGSRESANGRRRAAWPWAGFSLLAVAAALVVWIETSTWRRMQTLQNDFVRANLDSFYLGVHLREGIGRMDGALFRFQLSSDDGERATFEREAQAITSLIRRSKAHLATPEERALVAEIESHYDAYATNSAAYLERGIRPIRKDTPSLLHRQLSSRSAPLIALADRLVETQHGALNRFMVSAGGALGSLQQLLAVSVLLLLLLVIAVAALLSRAVIAPLRARLDASQVIIQRQEKLASLGALAAGVAHEIRNPLTAIRLHLFSLKRTLPEGFEHNEDAAVIGHELTRLDRIVSDFLQFARPSEPEMTGVPVERLLGDVRQLLHVELDGRRITLRAEAEAGLTLQADRQQIQQVLINLIQNAADSIGQDGTIAIAARSAATDGAPKATPTVMVEITDTGHGIPPEVADRIFDPFFSTKESGTGLGLAIASRIMEKHGGTIRYSTHLHRGTTFQLTFPRISTDESALAPD